jgi:hypothetical protein
MALKDLQEANKIISELTKKLGELTNKVISPISAKDIKEANDEINKLNLAVEAATAQSDRLKEGFRGVYDELKAITDEYKKGNNAQKLAEKNLGSITSITQKFKFEQEGLNDLSLKEIISLEKQFKIQQSLLKENTEKVKQSLREKGISEETIQNLSTGNKISKEGIKYLIEKTGLNEKEFENIKSIISLENDKNNAVEAGVNLIKNRLELEQKVQKQVGIFGGLLKGINKIPILGNIFDANSAVSEMEEHLRKVDEKGNQINTTSSALTVGFKNIGNQIKTGVLNPANLLLGAITLLIKALVTSDKQTGELAKSFGNSYSEALSLRNELNTIANLSGDININTASLQKSLVAINKEFGTAAMLNGELLKDYTQLTEVAGYTNEAAAGLSKITLATGGDLSDNTSQILGQAVAFNAVNSLALNEKEIVEGVAKASSAATLSLGMQPKAITNAVIQAKALGTSLEKVEQIASSLLDFESSIQNELEAELLTGKAINLEVAREAALRGDLATVASEISNQIGTAADFTDMNVKAQEALAKSVGMTRNDLADSLMQREALARIGMEDKTALEAYNELKKQNLSDEQIATKLGDKKLAAQLKSQSTQEKFAASMEKLQEIFVSIAEPILQIVSPFMDLATTILPLINIALIPITGAIKFIGESIQFFLGGVKDAFSWLSIIGDLVSPMVEYFKGMVENSEALGATFSVVGGILKFIVGLLTTSYLIEQGRLLVAKLTTKEKERGIISTIKDNLLGKKGLLPLIGKAAMTAFTNLAKIPIIGIPLGIAAAASAAALGYKFMQGNDIMSPGYGSRTLMGPEGAIALNNKDTVIAGTNLFPEGDTKEDTLMSSPSMPSINLEPLIQEMQGLKDGIERLITLVSEGGDVYIDGTKVGKTLSLVTSKMG